LQSRFQRRSPRVLLALLAIACTVACAPVVTHSPRVEGGTRLVMTAGASAPLCENAECDLALLPQVSLGVRTGRPAGEANAGFTAGVNLTMNIVSSDVDLYAQAPTGLARGLDAGVRAQRPQHPSGEPAGPLPDGRRHRPGELA
jgi:hypothetical protein